MASETRIFILPRDFILRTHFIAFYMKRDNITALHSFTGLASTEHKITPTRTRPHLLHIRTLKSLFKTS